jgi:hypothetical protein
MKKFTFATMTVCTTFLLFGCTEESSANPDAEAKIQELETTIEGLKAEAFSAEGAARFHEEEVTMYNALTTEMVKKMNEQELLALAKLAWKYDITVNDQPIPPEGMIEVEDSKIEVSLNTKQISDSVLPPEIHNKGAISGKYEEHLKKIEPKPTESGTRDGTVVTSAYHTFNEVEQGKTITITITDELKERAGLDTTTITIKRK